MRELVFPVCLVALLVWMTACQNDISGKAGTFGEDVSFLKNYVDTIILADPTGLAQVAVVPEFQGRVMTSTSSGLDGPSFGWINRSAIASRERRPHINVFGGEDRFWLGPEGGQFSIFFPPDSAFTLENWQTPEPIDWGFWEIVSRSGDAVHFRREMRLVNYSRSEFQLTVDRTVRLRPRDHISRDLAIPLPPGLEVVAFESENRITNSGPNPWSKQTGLLSIWILGMFKPSDDTTIFLPYHAGEDMELGLPVNDSYFGKVPPDRLKLTKEMIFFRGDGKWRSKIGVGPRRAKPRLGSYAEADGTLTLVQFSLPGNAADYVNSMWEIQDDPYGGDVVNSYNDGPPEPGVPPLGPFYELETSSPAASLAPGQSITHTHTTMHFRGPRQELGRLVGALFQIELSEIADAFEAVP